jgi:hypothetical protein
MRRILLVMTAGALLLSSTAASAEAGRISTPVGDREQLAGNPWVPWLVALIAALAIVLFIVDDDEPQSP